MCIDCDLPLLEPAFPGIAGVADDVSQKMHAGDHQKGDAEYPPVTGGNDFFDGLLSRFEGFLDGGEENLRAHLPPDLKFQLVKKESTGMIGAVAQDQNSIVFGVADESLQRSGGPGKILGLVKQGPADRCFLFQ